MNVYDNLVYSALNGNGGGGGGGSSSYKLLASTQATIESNPSTDAELLTLACGAEAWTTTKIIYVKIRRTEKVKGYYLGGDFWFINRRILNGSASDEDTCARLCEFISSADQKLIQASGYGVYAKAITKDGDIKIWAKAGNYATCKGDYIIEAYALSYPNDDYPYPV